MSVAWYWPDWGHSSDDTGTDPSQDRCPSCGHLWERMRGCTCCGMGHDDRTELGRQPVMYRPGTLAVHWERHELRIRGFTDNYWYDSRNPELGAYLLRDDSIENGGYEILPFIAEAWRHGVGPGPSDPWLDQPAGHLDGQENAPGTVTPQQQRAIHAACTGMDRDKRLATISDIVGRQTTSSNELSYTEAARVLRKLSGARA